ncbi:hypothetical protein [Streptomyces sp. C8S0]|uniref:hypothetical protein n=1 Tax=Streptomyces sp. C8S0 TaxID=2585716 RepID=UPI001868ADD9|nr:hypothetical protein [Streptomyces sp. C8S0]
MKRSQTTRQDEALRRVRALQQQAAADYAAAQAARQASSRRDDAHLTAEYVAATNR